MKRFAVCLFLMAFLLAGCAMGLNNIPSAPTGLRNLNSIWDEIYAISQTGKSNESTSYKMVAFEDGARFYFGSSPVDNSIGILMTLPESPTIGIAILMVNGKPCEPQKILITPFGILGDSCDIIEAEEIAKSMLKEYQTRLSTMKQIPANGTDL